MSASHMTDAEIAALNDSALPRDAPFLIRGVTTSHLSIARHYGGCTFNGRHYVYVPPTDELIRKDVMGWLARYRRKPKTEAQSLPWHESGEE